MGHFDIIAYFDKTVMLVTKHVDTGKIIYTTIDLMSQSCQSIANTLRYIQRDSSVG